MTTKSDLISLSGASSLGGLSKINFDIHVEIPLLDSSIIQPTVDRIRERALTILQSNNLTVVDDVESAPSLKLFINLNQARDCVTGIDFFLYRVELVLREYVTTERNPSVNCLADTWRMKSGVGHVALSHGLRALEAAVLAEVERQRKQFVAALTNSLAVVASSLHTPTEIELDGAVGKHISSFCGNGFTANSSNHCAHFVSHILNLQFGTTCRDLAGGAAPPASVRVQDLFSHCNQVGTWSSLPTVLTWGLIFITNPANVDLATKTMRNVPNKHVGIFFGGLRNVYQYKNALQKVVKQTPLEFGQHYSAPDNGLFWGSL